MSSFARRLLTRPVGRPLERLEDRSVPATLVTLAADGTSPLNAPVDLLATSDDGRYVLFQTKATNVVSGQIDPVGTTDLFWRDTSTGVTLLVSGAAGAGGGPRVAALGVEASTPGVKNNAVLSANGLAVAFLSGANANKFDPTLAAVLDDGGVDAFRWEAPASPGTTPATITLASRDRPGFAIGSFAGVDNVGISADGLSIGFISDVNPFSRIDGKYFAGKKGSAIDIAPPGPNLFVQVGTGEIPQLVTYDWTAFNSLDPADTSVDFYRQYSDVSVDPLGRYMSAAGVSFVVTRDYRNQSFFGFFNPQNPFAPPTTATGKDAWRFSFAGVGQPPPRDLVQNLLSYGTGTYTDPASGLPVNEGFAFAGLQGYGTVQNAYIARDRGDVAVYSLTTNTTVQRGDGSGFTFDPITGRFIPAPTVAVAAKFEPVPGYVPNSTNRTDLFVAQFSGASGNVQFGYNNTLVTGRFGSATEGQGGSVGSDDFRGVLDPSSRGFVLSSDGSKITYATSATDVIDGVSDKNRGRDVFQFNVLTGETTLVSASAAAVGLTAQGDSYNPLVTQDGQLVGFESTAGDLTVDTFNNRLPDTNGLADIFVRDVASKVTTQASLVPGNGAAGNGKSFNPVLGGTFQNGKVYFTSAATDLDVNFPNGLPPGTPPQGYGTSLPLLLPKLPRFVAFSGGGGRVSFGTTNLNGTLTTTQTVQPFGKNYLGELRVATGDFNGDGTIDVIVGAGPGGGPRVAVLDGATGRTIRDFFAFEPRFTGGVYVALGDVNGDGRADIIVGAGEGGGPRVQITDSATDRVLVDAFVYESTFRGGARVAAGDVTGDGRTDLITGAGIGGGPRITVFDGAALPNLVTYTNFFAFEPSLRGGAYVSAGDYDGDGKAEVVAGGGPDGGPRVAIFDAANIVLFDPNKRVTFADFFAFDPNSRNGARPELKDIDGDGLADLIVGTGNGFPLIRTFSGALRGSADTSLQQLQSLNPFTDTISLSGAWVG